MRVAQVSAAWPFLVLGAIHGTIAWMAWQNTRREYRSQHDQSAFNLAVEYGITALAFVFVATLGLVDPVLVATAAIPGQTTMATGTVLSFAALGAGRIGLLALQRRGQHGTHPMQRPSIADVAAVRGREDSTP